MTTRSLLYRITLFAALAGVCVGGVNAQAEDGEGIPVPAPGSKVQVVPQGAFNIEIISDENGTKLIKTGGATGQLILQKNDQAIPPGGSEIHGGTLILQNGAEGAQQIKTANGQIIILGEGKPNEGQVQVVGGLKINNPNKLSDYYLGIECFPTDAALRAQLNLPDFQGLIVEQIVKGSPAERAGLKHFDVLVTANDKKLGEVADLMAVVDATKGNEVNLRILRGGKEQTIAVKPAKREGDDKAEIKSGWIKAENKFFDLPVPAANNQEVLKKALKTIEELQKQGADPAKINAVWAEILKAQGAAVKQPLEIHAMAPGFFVGDGGKLNELPENMTVTIIREGKKAAKIKVQQGDQNWDISEKEIDKLPEQVRGFVGPLVGRMDYLRFRTETKNAFRKPEGELKPGESPYVAPKGEIKKPGEVKPDASKVEIKKFEIKSSDNPAEPKPKLVKPNEEVRGDSSLKKEVEELRRQVQELHDEMKASRKESANKESAEKKPADKAAQRKDKKEKKDD